VLAASLTLTEVLTKPIQVDNRRLQHQYRDFLLSTRNLNVVATDVIIAIKAAELRAAHNLKTPDALHVATAIMRGADAFLTNDAGIRRVDEITVLVLDDLESDPPDADAS
jgi:predicted nucleic acid-binding protein